MLADPSGAVAKLHASRSGSLSALEATLSSLQSSRDAFASQYSGALEKLSSQIAQRDAEAEASNVMAAEVMEECKRFKRLLRAQNT